jgi:hypothetical protein
MGYSLTYPDFLHYRRFLDLATPGQATPGSWVERPLAWIEGGTEAPR